MVVRIENTPAGLTAWLSGELDHHAAGTIREQVDHAVERYHPRELTLDFSGVGFMDSSGIGLVMGRYRLMKLYEGTLTVTSASPRIAQLMKLAGLDKLGVVRPAQEEKSSQGKDD